MGETCSPWTPRGLRFTSTPLSDTIGDVPPIALGGRTTIGFSPLGGYELPEFSVDVGAGLDASDARRVGNRGEVVVRGVTETEIEGSYLRILAADESGLLDRISLQSRAVTQRGLRPYVGLFQSLHGPFDASSWRYWHELPALTVIAILRDSEGTRVVDESLALSASVGLPTALAEGYERTWDTLPLDVAGVGSIEVGVGESTFTLTAVDAVDGLVQLPRADEGSVFRDAFVCFAATRADTPVVGAPLTYQWAGEDAVVAFGGLLEDYPFVDSPCVAIPSGSGTRALTIRGPSVEETFDVTLGSADGALRGALPSAARDGERAGG